MRFLLAIFLLCMPVFALTSDLHREGPYWVDTAVGIEPANSTTTLTVTCLGNITIRGGVHTQLRYSLKRRLRARNEWDAHARLSEASVSLERKGRSLQLVVDDATGPVDLDITLPRAVRGVAVHTIAGAVEISDLDGFVEAEANAGKVSIARIKGSIEIESAGGPVKLIDIGGNAHVVSAGGDIVADTVKGHVDFETEGNISIQRAGLSVRAQTAGGTVTIGSSGGPVVIDSQGGQLDIGNVNGMVTIRNSGGGPIQIASANGVACDSASGLIRIASAGGGIRAHTASGNITAEINAAQNFASSLLSTAAGDITVYVPSNLHVTIRAHNDGARRDAGIVSEFAGIAIRNAGLSVTAEGALNGGGPVLRIEGNGGVIWIKRK